MTLIDALRAVATATGDSTLARLLTKYDAAAPGSRMRAEAWRSLRWQASRGAVQAALLELGAPVTNARDLDVPVPDSSARGTPHLDHAWHDLGD